MAIDEYDYRRWRALSEICGATRHGIVEGVEIDLRHELLSASDWTMNTLGIETPPRYKHPCDPFIWFPWYGIFNKGELRREAELNFQKEEADLPARRARLREISPEDRHVERSANSYSAARYVKDHTPENIVYAGDKLVIEQVYTRFIGDAFDHPHDAEIRFAILRIVRRNGESETVKSPVIFNGVTSIYSWRSSRNYFDKIAFRICRHYGVRYLSEIGPEGMVAPKPEQRFAAGAAFHARLIAEETSEIRKLADWSQFEEPGHHEASRTWSILNSAVLMGYVWAKAEAESFAKPLAMSALRGKRGASLGGSRSGVERQRKRAETWEPIARSMATKIRADNPSFSQDDVATEIAGGWKEAVVSPPGHTTLKSLVSAMEKAGQLPPRQRPRSSKGLGPVT